MLLHVFSVLVLALVLGSVAPACSLILAAALLPSNRNCIQFVVFFQHLQNQPHHVSSETPALASWHCLLGGLSPASLGSSFQLLAFNHRALFPAFPQP